MFKCRVNAFCNVAMHMVIVAYGNQPKKLQHHPCR
jgi:hypothetical protein